MTTKSEERHNSSHVQCNPQRTIIPDRLTPPIPLKQFMGSPGQHTPDLSTFAPDPWDHHAIVGSRLVTHPGDDGSLGPLLNGDAFRSSNASTSDRRGMVGDSLGNSVGEINVISVKAQERHDRSEELLDIFGLCFFSSPGVGFLLLGEALGGSLGFEIGTNALDGRRRCPDTS